MGSKRVSSKDTQLWRIIKAPIRVLARARDLYVQSLTGGHVSYGNAMGCPTPQIPSLPRSDSISSSRSGDEELRDLIMRQASAPNYSHRRELRRTQSSLPLGGGGGGGAAAPVARSNTVGCGRIDEDKPLMSFGEDEEARLVGGVYPVRSHAAVSGGIEVA